MENLEIILSIAATAIGLLVTTITFLVKFIKNGKLKRAAEHIVKIGNAIVPYIEQAEKFIGYSGEEKKEYVMTKANQFAIEKGIDFDANAVSNKIEELVSLTKQVNVRKHKTAEMHAQAEATSATAATTDPIGQANTGNTVAAPISAPAETQFTSVAAQAVTPVNPSYVNSLGQSNGASVI